eukprot:TRINITY_DN4715_c0_g1::TRINITY_DN4715_c0_g1_i1::g.21263::m.21263 TRINITY_DN4715_c0_g1::TRINITY_DN4715_c0_g1_i1::g.21263  ORF type:complete len:914 (+),score=165.85,sp/Q9SY59/NFXL1_ARATH/35.41/3e-128,zf-NF-X1/PF01422.12/4e+02,zf-NF-X1/PF01422.12/0.0098,zf-NF-X1/PF01422.12/0.00056,zf-NF-X1/PF01422.12/0.00064,zf-NF-X1/PF01422.12/0.031,zf-NF-X1/PF01422.12/1.5e+04,zf-NF-X1/PF01422.12/8.8e+03,zf-NF-X1/PF01422.12/1.8,zf-NF-X1/PF01422.12/4.9e-05,zf-NF-X1/PF01422.12/26,zf-NF-X1/PF01422.12/0.013,zf-NF-X1/P
MAPPSKCFCKKTSYQLRCGEADQGRSCGRECRKRHNACGHPCAALCHPGACPPCIVPREQECYCGRNKATRPCGEAVRDRDEGSKGEFSCTETCGRLLDCGNHTCQEKCHAGPCAGCPTHPSRLRSCPCSRTWVPFQLRKSCTDPIPVCTKTCGKKLEPCGVHLCEKECHAGPCGTCQGVLDTTCRCGACKVTVKCAELNTAAAMCTKPCGKKLSCGKHRCGNLCCPGRTSNVPEGYVDDVHFCLRECGKPMQCGLHRCDRLCHLGPCPPCGVLSMEPLLCPCGRASVAPPVPCGTRRPECSAICQIARPCGHPPYHTCHEGPCPPCTVLVQKKCAGGHEIRQNIPCHVPEVFCGTACGKTLSCGQHKCMRQCHSGTCVVPSSTSPTGPTVLSGTDSQNDAKIRTEPSDAWYDDDEDVRGGSSGSKSAKDKGVGSGLVGKYCDQKCGLKRAHCEHTCMAPCHAGSPCPQVPCKASIVLHCPCGRRSASVVCMRGAAGSPEVMVSSAPKTQSSTSSSSSSAAHSDHAHDGGDGIGAGAAQVDLRAPQCDDECARLIRNQKFADALGIDPEKPGNGQGDTRAYSDFLVNLARTERQFVISLEKSFDLLLRDSKLYRDHRLEMPVMPRERRAAVYELGEHYGFKVTTEGTDPKRYCCVQRLPKSCAPAVLLSHRVPLVLSARPEKPVQPANRLFKNVLTQPAPKVQTGYAVTSGPIRFLPTLPKPTNRFECLSSSSATHSTSVPTSTSSSVSPSHTASSPSTHPYTDTALSEPTAMMLDSSHSQSHSPQDFSAAQPLAQSKPQAQGAISLSPFAAPFTTTGNMLMRSGETSPVDNWEDILQSLPEPAPVMSHPDPAFDGAARSPVPY